MKKLTFVAMITILAFIAVMLLGSPVSAENNALEGRVLNCNEDCVYYVLDQPQDVHYSEEGIYIQTADDWYLFADKTVCPAEVTAEDMAFMDDLVTLHEGDITYNGKVTEGSFTAISAMGDALYALDGNVISKFGLYEGSLFLSGEYVAASSPIGMIAATPDGCAYTVMSADKYTSIIYIGNKEYAVVEDEIVDIAFSDKLYVLTPSSIRAFTDRFNYLEFPLSGAVALDASDKVYVAMRNGSILSLPPDLKATTALITGSSDLPWFYSSPVGGDTRLGKLFVADRDNNRVAVITRQKTEYLTGLFRPVSVAADNTGKVYVAHHGNKIACFKDGVLISDDVYAEADIIDIEIDFKNNLYCLTENDEVISNGEVVRSKVKAFEFGGVWHYLSDSGYIDDKNIPEAEDFCVDAANNVFAVSGNTVTAVIGDVQTVYRVSNAAHIASVELSKVDNELISYGDLILFDDIKNCLLIIDGETIGTVNVKDVYPDPVISSDPLPRTEGLIAVTESELCMFRLPVEGEIVHLVKDTDRIIICKDIPAPEPFAYCLCDDADSQTLYRGYIYKTNLTELPYSDPANNEVKINVDNTPLYKYPSVNAPKVASLNKGTMVSTLPFAVTFRDEYDVGWFTDVYTFKWYRTAYGANEGYLLAADTTARFFSEKEMPKANATITENAVLYRYDEATGEYEEFVGAGSYIAKDTRVMVETPYDSSRQYTKIVFYREGYGTIDTDCYVKTEYIRFDGADIIKIVAAAVIIVALLTLILVLIRKHKNDKKRDRREIRINE